MTNRTPNISFLWLVIWNVTLLLGPVLCGLEALLLLVRTMTNLCILCPGDDTKRSWATPLKVCKVTKRNSEAREVGVRMIAECIGFYSILLHYVLLYSASRPALVRERIDDRVFWKQEQFPARSTAPSVCPYNGYI